MDWFYITIIATFLFGIQGFLFKMSAAKKCNSAWMFFSFTATVSIISLLLYIIIRPEYYAKEPILFMFFGILAALIFIISIISRTEAMKFLDSTIVYPTIRMSTIFTVIYSIIIFKETLNKYHIIGIIIGMIAIYILTNNENNKSRSKNIRKGLILTAIALLTSALSTIIMKYIAIIDLDIFAFMAFSYGINVILAFLLRKKLHGKKDNGDHKNAIKIGIITGLVNLTAFYLILKAMAVGPLSLISVILSMGFIVTMGLAVIFYKEKLDRYKIAGILLSIIAILLMKMV